MFWLSFEHVWRKGVQRNKKRGAKSNIPKANLNPRPKRPKRSKKREIINLINRLDGVLISNFNENQIGFYP